QEVSLHPTAPERTVRRAARLDFRSRVYLLLDRFRGPAGEREEYLVEARLADRKLRNRKLRRGKGHKRLCDLRVCRDLDAQRRRVAAGVDRRTEDLPQDGLRLQPPFGCGHSDVEGVSADRRLQLTARTLGDQPAVV